ncbi:hypothetical protein ACC739_37655, partial [Rhizobium ruizarguesonis]
MPVRKIKILPEQVRGEIVEKVLTGQFGLPEVHVDADFGDILNNLDFAFMAAGEVDAVAGVRGNYLFTPEIYVTGWGLVGAG